MPTIHWLGAGLSSAPGIRRLAASDRPFVLWNRTLAKAQAVLEDVSKEARELNWSELVTSVQPGDVVVSMLPADLHQRVAELCLQGNAHFVCSSYLSPVMDDLGRRGQGEGSSVCQRGGARPGHRSLDGSCLDGRLPSIRSNEPIPMSTAFVLIAVVSLVRRTIFVTSSVGRPWVSCGP